MEKKQFRHIRYADIRPRLGSSCMPPDLPYFTGDENRFRMQVRDYAIRELLPHVDWIEETDDKERNIPLSGTCGTAGCLPCLPGPMRFSG